MNTKNVVLAGIAACAISLLLISPVLASEDDYILDIYGNANEDDTIDMRDFTYTARIILWLEDETDLADANYDGEVNVLDMTQIGLIILGRESELTIVDSVDRIVTVKKPVKTTVVLTYPVAEAIKIVKAEKKVVGVSRDIAKRTVFFPELSKLPSAGEASSPGVEKIIELSPDIVCTGRLLGVADGLEEKLPDNIALARWDMGRLEMMTTNVRKLGYIFDMEEEAEQFCEFYQEYIDETIKERVDKIPDADKQRVYVEHIKDYYAFCTGSAGHEVCVAAGGINIAADLPRVSERPIVEVDKEWLVDQDPQVIVKTVLCKPGICGHDADSAVKMKELREDLVSRPGWVIMTAVNTDRVYLIDMDLVGSTANFVSVAYMAKWFYPELFSDLDPQAVHQEYLTRFQRLDYDLDVRGVFVYPPLSNGEEVT
ncbi:MAG: ABC transporter substrate-binding protein [Methanophagales archaeon]|nr:ABC transporter substrate-binding protein [Methanophagales archaeon]